jgi:hypothetical protein
MMKDNNVLEFKTKYDFASGNAHKPDELYIEDILEVRNETLAVIKRLTAPKQVWTEGEKPKVIRRKAA